MTQEQLREKLGEELKQMLYHEGLSVKQHNHIEKVMDIVNTHTAEVIGESKKKISDCPVDCDKCRIAIGNWNACIEKQWERAGIDPLKAFESFVGSVPMKPNQTMSGGSGAGGVGGHGGNGNE